jgi:hypothetical protein
MRDRARNLPVGFVALLPKLFSFGKTWHTEVYFNATSDDVDNRVRIGLVFRLFDTSVAIVKGPIWTVLSHDSLEVKLGKDRFKRCYGHK